MAQKVAGYDVVFVMDVELNIKGNLDSVAYRGYDPNVSGGGVSGRVVPFAFRQLCSTFSAAQALWQNLAVALYNAVRDGTAITIFYDDVTYLAGTYKISDAIVLMKKYEPLIVRGSFTGYKII